MASHKSQFSAVLIIGEAADATGLFQYVGHTEEFSGLATNSLYVPVMGIST
jgi:hypothetical protein